MVPLPSVEGCEDKFIYYRLVDCDPDKVRELDAKE